ncbi:MAG: DUF3592 domain-containing protein [Bacteroidetes bacterium]|nr:DUF3592 domain-containing protein [Bacteroidota bacterium]
MNKVRPWELWDWETIRNVAVLLIAGGIGLTFLFRFPDLLRNSKSLLLTETTTGTFIRSENLTQLGMSKRGNYIRATGIEIEYAYMVNGVTYYSKDRIPNSTQHLMFFKKLRNNPGMRLKLNYNPSNPQESQINTDTE